MVIVGRQVQAGGRGRVRQHDVQLARFERAQQLVQRALPAHELHRLRQVQRCIHQSLRDLLRHDVVDACNEAHRLVRRTLRQRAHEIRAEREDLLRVAEHEPPALGRHQRAAGLHQQPGTEPLLERAQLRAHCRRGQVQLRAGLRQAAVTDHCPEVEQVLVVRAGGWVYA